MCLLLCRIYVASLLFDFAVFGLFCFYCLFFLCCFCCFLECFSFVSCLSCVSCIVLRLPWMSFVSLCLFVFFLFPCLLVCFPVVWLSKSTREEYHNFLLLAGQPTQIIKSSLTGQSQAKPSPSSLPAGPTHDTSRERLRANTSKHPFAESDFSRKQPFLRRFSHNEFQFSKQPDVLKPLVGTTPNRRASHSNRSAAASQLRED